MKSNLSYLKIWGCDAYVKSESSYKLAGRSIKCMFVGYPNKTKGYFFYLPNEHKVIVARYATFLEREFMSKEGSWSKVSLEEISDFNQRPKWSSGTEGLPQGSWGRFKSRQSRTKLIIKKKKKKFRLYKQVENEQLDRKVVLLVQITPPADYVQEIQDLRKSTRIHREPMKYGCVVTQHEAVLFIENDDPSTYEEVIASIDSEKW